MKKLRVDQLNGGGGGGTGVFKHNLKILKEGQSHCFVCVMDFFLSLFFLSFFFSARCNAYEAWS